MKEFIEKLIGRLEELQKLNYEAWEVARFFPDKCGYINTANAYANAISIVNQLAEEYNNGWIPVSSGNPKETGLYQVTVDDNDEPVITAM